MSARKLPRNATAIVFNGETVGYVYNRSASVRAAVTVNGQDFDVALTSTTKMPGYSWNLPAGEACPASKLTIKRYGDASVCSACYAKGGNYQYPNVKQAMSDRMALVTACVRMPGGFRLLAAILTALVRRGVEVSGEAYFRIHDSGDFFHPSYVDAWRLTAEACPDVRFWAPTREYLRPLMLPSLRALAALPNTFIRPSAQRVNDPAPIVDGLTAGSAVTSASAIPAGHFACPATTTDRHECDAHGCRACWSNVPVVYQIHGQNAKRAVAAADAAAVVAA